MAVGNILGSVTTTASLDSLTGTNTSVPQGGTVIKNSGVTQNPGNLSGNQYADYTGNNGLYGASLTFTANYSLSGTGSNTSSSNVAAFVNCPNNFSGNEHVAISWVASNNTLFAFDAVLSAVNATAFNASFPAGQPTLPANGTTITLATNMDLVFNIPAAANVQQVIGTTTQLAALEWLNAGTLRAPGVVLMSPSVVPAANANYVLVNSGSLTVNAAASSGFYSNVGNPFNVGQAYTVARAYSFATDTAIISAAVLVA
jgi:hypothetical protein